MTGFGGAVLVPPGKGERFRIGADRFLRKGTAKDASGGFAVVEYVGAGGVPGPPLHRHRTWEEAWFLLDGKVEFRAGRRRGSLGRGSYLLVPRGVPHTFRVVGRRPARWIGIFSPGANVRLLEELGPLMPDFGPPDPEKFARLLAKYDTELVGESPRR